MKRIGILGYGEIGSWIARRIVETENSSFKLAAICVRDRQRDLASSADLNGARICTDMDEFLGDDLDAVVEAAGQAAVVQSARKILEHGCDLLMLSSGALANAALREQLSKTATANDVQIRIPSGALAGFRGLMALRQAGLTSVAYTSVKPCRAWAGTPVAAELDLNSLTSARVIFEGNAAEAAFRFPANANLAAAVAIAGIGFEETRVTLLADPHTNRNTGTVEAVCPDASMKLTVSGRAYEGNPKSSRITGMSVVAALHNDGNAICFA
jgi:aspartate dehydrogenase